jgi:hypothetical protein
MRGYFFDFMQTRCSRTADPRVCAQSQLAAKLQHAGKYTVPHHTLFMIFII